jgi:hypothetical protein
MAVRVERTKVGTLVEWDEVSAPSGVYELVAERGVEEGEIALTDDIVAYGVTFMAKAVLPEPE